MKTQQDAADEDDGSHPSNEGRKRVSRCARTSVTGLRKLLAGAPRPSMWQVPPLLFSSTIVGNSDDNPLQVRAAVCRCGSPHCAQGCGAYLATKRQLELMGIILPGEFSMITLTLDPKRYPSPLHAHVEVVNGRFIGRFVRELNIPAGRKAHIEALRRRFPGGGGPQVAAAIRRLEDPRPIRYHRTLEFQMSSQKARPPTEMPHFHLLIDIPFVCQEWALQKWARISGGQGCYCEPISRPLDAVRYVTKPQELPDWALRLPARRLKKYSCSRGFWDGARDPKPPRKPRTVSPQRVALRIDTLAGLMPGGDRIFYVPGPSRRLGHVLDSCRGSVELTVAAESDDGGLLQRDRQRFRVPWELAAPALVAEGGLRSPDRPGIVLFTSMDQAGVDKLVATLKTMQAGRPEERPKAPMERLFYDLYLPVPEALKKGAAWA